MLARFQMDPNVDFLGSPHRPTNLCLHAREAEALLRVLNLHAQKILKGEKILDFLRNASAVQKV